MPELDERFPYERLHSSVVVRPLNVRLLPRATDLLRSSLNRLSGYGKDALTTVPIAVYVYGLYSAGHGTTERYRGSAGYRMGTMNIADLTKEVLVEYADEQYLAIRFDPHYSVDVTYHIDSIDHELVVFTLTS